MHRDMVSLALVEEMRRQDRVDLGGAWATGGQDARPRTITAGGSSSLGSGHPEVPSLGLLPNTPIVVSNT